MFAYHAILQHNHLVHHAQMEDILMSQIYVKLAQQIVKHVLQPQRVVYV
jgi:hypothetical protein